MKPYYQHAGITIFLGDCREILPTLPRVDLVLTDPPYGETPKIRSGKHVTDEDYICSEVCLRERNEAPISRLSLPMVAVGIVDRSALRIAQKLASGGRARRPE